MQDVGDHAALVGRTLVDADPGVGAPHEGFEGVGHFAHLGAPRGGDIAGPVDQLGSSDHLGVLDFAQVGVEIRHQWRGGVVAFERLGPVVRRADAPADHREMREIVRRLRQPQQLAEILDEVAVGDVRRELGEAEGERRGVVAVERQEVAPFAGGCRLDEISPEPQRVVEVRRRIVQLLDLASAEDVVEADIALVGHTPADKERRPAVGGGREIVAVTDDLEQDRHLHPPRKNAMFQVAVSQAAVGSASYLIETYENISSAPQPSNIVTASAARQYVLRPPSTCGLLARPGLG